MPTPKKTIETPKKPEPLVIIPDTVADFTPATIAAATVPAETPDAPAVALETGVGLVETTAEAVAKAGLSTVANNIQNTKSEIKTTMDKAFGQGNIEAMMKSSQIWMTGLQDLSKSFAATAQAQMEETVSTMKTFAGLRSIKDAVDLQTAFARVSFEKAMSETGKITESSMKLAEQAMAPLTARVTIAVEKFSRAA
jgi:phasin family protein